MDLLGHLREEWHVLKGAPIAFFVSIALGAISGWFAAKQLDQSQIATLTERNSYLSEQLQYRNAEIDELESRLNAEVKALREELHKWPQEGSLDGSVASPSADNQSESTMNEMELERLIERARRGGRDRQ